MYGGPGRGCHPQGTPHPHGEGRPEGWCPVRNPSCDGDVCTSAAGETRKLPIGGGGNLLLCRACFDHEMAYRRELEEDGRGKQDIPEWGDLEIVTPCQSLMPAAAEDPEAKAGREAARNMINVMLLSHDPAAWRRRSWFAGLMDARTCRLARQYSSGQIIFGQRGYKLREKATPEEVAACIKTLESQGKELLRQAIELRRAAHKGIS